MDDARPASASPSTEPAEELTLEQALSIAGWPASILRDESKRPWILDDPRVSGGGL